MLQLLKNKYTKCFIACLLYFLWVWWSGIYLLLPGLIIIFDIYISRLVNWSFLKKHKDKNTKFSRVVEWGEFILFAFFLVVFISIFLFKAYFIPTSSMDETIKAGDYIFASKLSYGPRIPSRPVSIPFIHNKLPFTNYRSYSDRIKLNSTRLSGIRKIKHDDIVVFNFPEGDTVLTSFQGHSYYYLKRTWGDDYINKHYSKTSHPVDRKEYYVKRCVALPGDIISIKNGFVFLNYDSCSNNKHIKHKYFIKIDSLKLDINDVRKNGLLSSDLDNYDEKNSFYEIPLTEKQANKIKQYPQVIGIMKYENTNVGFETEKIFPHDKRYNWTEDIFGPIYVPAKGHKIKLDNNNLPLFERIITVYENNKLSIRNDSIFINDSAANSYTFKMNYYFMMGDNRHYSGDSRYWGFVPEDHIEGKALFVLFSFNKSEAIFHKIKWNRIFRPIR